ncbi:ABC transporter G family member 20 isoform X1 [Folsomia candida]|uniref:ABC transporter G family member 20 isoform X1 n=1 Tax=Folsomia candida TaxID=158441 RepID=UPI0016051058|nr:ABC transporter G family member 20 isoform X1 [Folsomia candida]
MRTHDIKERIEFLSNFLDLPQINKVVQDLSGGQKRRVSLAAAMIHNPKLLVLDEPCVGLDPVLRQRIWKYLHEICRDQGTSIIISTHYIEETKFCEKVGFMRGGRLLAEDSPKSLLSTHEAATMEKLVFKLCQHDQKESNYPKFKCLNQYGLQEIVVLPPKSPAPRKSLNTNVYNGSKIYALMFKWFHRHRRDLRFHMFQLLLPVMCMFTLQNVLGPVPNRVKLSFVHNSNLSYTDVLKTYCRSNFPNSLSQECFANVGICNFIDTFVKNEFIWVPANSYEEGLDQIKQGKTAGLIEFPQNYAMHLKNRMAFRNFADNETILGSTISVRLDEADRMLAFWMRRTIFDRYLVYMGNILASCSLPSDITRPPIHFNAIYGSNETFEYIAFIRPAYAIVVMFTVVLAIPVIMAEDKMAGLVDRDHVSGVYLWHQLTATFATQSLIILVQIGIVLEILHGFYGMVINGSWVTVVALMYATAFTGMSIAFLVGALCDGLMANILIILSIITSMIFTTGIYFPLTMMTWWFRQVANFIPMTLLVDAMRSICSRGSGITTTTVVLGFLSAGGWISVSLIITIWAGRWRQK